MSNFFYAVCVEDAVILALEPSLASAFVELVLEILLHSVPGQAQIQAIIPDEDAFLLFVFVSWWVAGTDVCVVQQVDDTHHVVSSLVISSFVAAAPVPSITDSVVSHGGERRVFECYYLHSCSNLIRAEFSKRKTAVGQTTI